MPKVAYHADITAMSGKQGDQVYAESRVGGIRRSRVVPTNPNTPSQVAARRAFVQGSVGYAQLSEAHASLWEAYAATLHVTDPITGRTYSPAPGTVFTGLSSKYLQVNPTGVVPLTPPVRGFAGDTITLDAMSDPGGITITPSGANGLAIETEILVQKLPMTNRKPSKKAYRLKGLYGFTGPSNTHLVPLAVGRYALAYRFIFMPTGQTSITVPMGVIDVA